MRVKGDNGESCLASQLHSSTALVERVWAAAECCIFALRPTTQLMSWEREAGRAEENVECAFVRLDTLEADQFPCVEMERFFCPR